MIPKSRSLRSLIRNGGKKVEAHALRKAHVKELKIHIRELAEDYKESLEYKEALVKVYVDGFNEGVVG